MRAILVPYFAVALLAAPLAAQQLDVRVGPVGALARRSAAFAGAVGTATGTLTGLELSARRRMVGLNLRVFGGEFTATSGTSGAGTVANGDIRIFGGPAAASAVLGYGRRGFTGGLGTITWSFVQFGVRSAVPLGSSGIEANVALSIYGGVKNLGGSGKGSGKEAMTALVYTPPRAPVYVTLGYRIEQFTATGGSGDRPEEVSAIFVGAGYRLAR